MQKYRRKQKTLITAVRLDVETDGFEYQKWGGTQRCKRGDWLVNNQGDVYSIDADTFELTYRNVTPGVYEKDAPVWAVEAESAGTITTKEGATSYHAGDFIVYNQPEGKDGYAVAKDFFHSLYEPVGSEPQL